MLVFVFILENKIAHDLDVVFETNEEHGLEKLVVASYCLRGFH